MLYRCDTSVGSESEHWAEYADNDTEQTYDAHRRHYYRTLWKWVRRMPARAHGTPQVLDVGAVPGMLLREAANDGWGIHGAETSAELCEMTAEFCGACMWQGFVEEIDFRGQQFDLITIADVFRAMTSPREALEACFAALAPGGCLVIREINAAHERHRAGRIRHPYPFDMQFVDAASACAFLRAAHFDDVEVHNCPMSLLTVGPIGRLAHEAPAAYRAVLGAVNCAVGVLDIVPRIADRPVTPSFLAVGRKR